MAKKLTMSAADKKKFKLLLMSLRARLVGDVEMLAKEALAGDGGNSHAPTHMADAGSDAYEQEFTLGLMASDSERLIQIQDALERIRTGQYGACAECGGKIPKARLEIIPEALYCVKCAGRLET